MDAETKPADQKPDPQADKAAAIKAYQDAKTAQEKAEVVRKNPILVQVFSPLNHS